MFAIVETGGKQVKATAGSPISIEKLPQNEGEKVSLNKVLMVISQDETTVGNPYIKGAVVNGHIIEQGKADKVIVYKMRPKKGTRKKQGHRQLFSRVLIDNIELDGKIIAKTEGTVKKASKKKEE